MVALNDAYAKLSALSDDRVRRVVELIDDLAELQGREDADDLAAARAVLAEIEAGEQTRDWEDVKRELDALHGSEPVSRP